MKAQFFESNRDGEHNNENEVDPIDELRKLESKLIDYRKSIKAPKGRISKLML
jgi:hypothetical protein